MADLWGPEARQLAREEGREHRFASSHEAVAQSLAEEFAAKHRVCAGAILGRARKRDVWEARREAFIAAKERYGWSNVEVARAFGKDPTTVLNAVNPIVRFNKMVTASARYRARTRAA
jgi:chromosomal replication initiation ATPase DnaA